MATEITEFSDPPFQFGGYVPVRPLPPLRHTQLALGNVLIVGQDTTIIMVTPGEDCRMRAAGGNGSQADPAAPGTDCILLKAGVPARLCRQQGHEAAVRMIEAARFILALGGALFVAAGVGIGAHQLGVPHWVEGKLFASAFFLVAIWLVAD